MADLNGTLSQLKPCDTSRPYIFISYSSRDRNTVWPDVLRFQQDGYNIWLDEKNLDKTKSSWKDDALRAINSRRCRLLLFYVSATSLCSEPCLREMQEAGAKRTVKNHFGPVHILVIEAQQIENIITFCQQVHTQLDREIDDEDEFEQKAQTLMDFKEEFFNGNHDRVRIQPRTAPNRNGNYYEDIERYFPPEAFLDPQPGPGPWPEPGPQPGPEPQPDPGPQPGPPVTPTAKDLQVVKTLGPTDIKYNICTFGAAFDIGAGAPVAVEMEGMRLERKMHNKTKGRVDGMKQLYERFGLRLGDTLEARYEAAEQTIRLKRVAPET